MNYGFSMWLGDYGFTSSNWMNSKMHFLSYCSRSNGSVYFHYSKASGKYQAFGRKISTVGRIEADFFLSGLFACFYLGFVRVSFELNTCLFYGEFPCQSFFCNPFPGNTNCFPLYCDKAWIGGVWIWKVLQATQHHLPVFIGNRSTF